MKRPQTAAAPGHEVFYFMRCSDVVVECCWVDSCSEDAYEFQEPLRNCVVRYCGGGEVSSSLVAGNMVDFYAAGGVWDSGDGNLGGHKAHHIWGSCQGDALIVDSVHNVFVHDIDVDNATPAARTLDEPPASNIRLHCRGATPLNGVVVLPPLTSASLSRNSKPCELTYEDATARTNCAGAGAGTVYWPYWNGTDWTYYVGAEDTNAAGTAPGIVDAMAT
jgi:hypothetical protein